MPQTRQTVVCRYAIEGERFAGLFRRDAAGDVSGGGLGKSLRLSNRREHGLLAQKRKASGPVAPRQKSVGFSRTGDFFTGDGEADLMVIGPVAPWRRARL